MTILSVVVATTPQQPIPAQEVPPNFSPLAKDKNGVCAPLPQGVFYEEFGGITFSSKQKAAYRKFDAEARKRYKPIIDNVREVALPGAGLSTEFKPGTSDKIAMEINDASVKMIQDNFSTDKQVKLLTKKYRKYAKFSVAKSVIYTPEQIAEGKRITRNWEAQTMAIMTPEQQKIYKVNLALQERIRDCGPRDLPIDRLMSPPPY